MAVHNSPNATLLLENLEPTQADGSTIVTATAQAQNGQTTSVSCPGGRFAIKGGFTAQGSVTDSFRNPTARDGR